LSESSLHLSLVIALKDWIGDSKILGEEPILYIDNPDSNDQSRPSKIRGHLPDVVAKNQRLNRELVGEAKTASDLTTKRSKLQIEDFIVYCSDNPDRLLALATVWDHVRYANVLVKEICASRKLDNLNYAIIDQFKNTVVLANGWI